MQGVEMLQFPPILNVVRLVLTTVKSPNWLAIETPDAPLEPSAVQMLVEVQPYRFAPAGTLTL
jgi:hypothetical protein